MMVVERIDAMSCFAILEGLTYLDILSTVSSRYPDNRTTFSLRGLSTPSLGRHLSNFSYELSGHPELTVDKICQHNPPLPKKNAKKTIFTIFEVLEKLWTIRRTALQK